MESPNYEHSPVSYAMEYKEPGECFTHCLDIAQRCPHIFQHNILVSGFFQNEGYFVENKEEIQYLLREPEHIQNIIQQKVGSYIPLFQQAYFLHIRLGDYVFLEKHWIHLEKYYLTALNEIFEKDPTAWIILFCNYPEDIPKYYGKVMAYLQQKNHMIVTDEDEVLNFYLMVRCKKGGICANSTYGWWASWLNTNSEKKVYMPNRWVNGPEEIRIYPSWATLLDVS